MKKIVVIMLTLIIVLTSSMAFAATDTSAASVITDMILLRPVGVASLGVGTAMYIVALPFALITRSHATTFKVLVKEPFEFVFVRPVGETGQGL